MTKPPSPSDSPAAILIRGPCASADWLRPPRSVLTVFGAIALVCVTALCWLAWLLFEHDKAVEAQQRQERVEQAADRAVAVMQRALANLAVHLRPLATTAELPIGVAVIEQDPTTMKVHPRGAVLYYPAPSATQALPADAFLAGEPAEFALRNLETPVARNALVFNFAEVTGNIWRVSHD